MAYFIRHSGAAPTGPREARPDDRLRGEPGIQMHKPIFLLASGFRVSRFALARNDRKLRS